MSLLASYFGLALNPSLFVTGFTDPINLFGGPSFTPGTNYAVAAATAAGTPLFGGVPNANLPQQVAAYGIHALGAADPNALYVVFAGGNDIRNAATHNLGTAGIAPGVASEVAAIQTLAGESAKRFLVVNVPNVGAIPEFTEDPTQNPALATTLSQQYDQLLAAQLGTLALPAGDRLTQFDIYGFNAGLAANAAALGFTNTTDPCFINTPLTATASPACGPNGAKVNQFLFWDAVHPTGPIHALWAQGFEAALVPEPATALLLAPVLIGLVARRRKPA